MSSQKNIAKQSIITWFTKWKKFHSNYKEKFQKFLSTIDVHLAQASIFNLILDFAIIPVPQTFLPLHGEVFDFIT